MAILKDLIVHGSSRFLNKIYANELETPLINADEARFTKLIAKDASLEDVTVTGLLDVQGQLHTNTWTNSNISTIEGSFYIMPTLSNMTDSDSNVLTFIASTLNSYPIVSVQIGSNQAFAGMGSLQFEAVAGVQNDTTGWTGGSKVLLTGEVKVGSEWLPLGTIVGTLNSFNNDYSSIEIVDLKDNKGRRPAPILLNFPLSSQIRYRNLKISLCERYISGNGKYYPIGIYMTALGSNGKTFLDIYGGGQEANVDNAGGLARPNVRIGNLNGLPSIGSQTPHGWGIYTTHGYFSGTVVADTGNIGGWTLTADSIWKGNQTFKNSEGMYFGSAGISLGSTFSVSNSGVLAATSGHIGGWVLTQDKLSIGELGEINSAVINPGTTLEEAREIGGSEELSNWIFTAGANFGVTGDGTLYANNANITGTINATSGNIGGIEIVDGRLQGENFGIESNGDIYINNANVTGTIIATSGNIGGIEIDENGKLNLSSLSIGDFKDANEYAQKDELQISKKITTYYLASSKSSDVVFEDEGWSLATPTVDENKKYLWAYQVRKGKENHDEGNIISFENDGDSILFDSLIVDIDPVQDLHGQDAPYPAGGGKNLIDASSVSVPTNSDNYVVFVQSIMLPAGTYTLSWTLDKNVSATRNRPYYLPSGASSGLVYGEPDSKTVGRHSWTFTLEEEKNLEFRWWYHTVSEACTISDFQLELGSTATAYAPYSNICPISGWTGVTVTRTGKNLLSSGIGRYNWAGGVRYINTNGMYCATEDKVSICGGQTYVASFNNTETTQSIYFSWFNGDTFLENSSAYAAPWKATAPTNADGVAISIRNANSYTGNPSVSNVQLELGSTATDYEPYQGNTYSVDWQTEAGTVYGGTIDVISGELVVDRAMVDLGTLNWQYNQSNNVFGSWDSPIRNFAGGGKCTCEAYAYSMRNIVDNSICIGTTGWYVGAIAIKDTSKNGDANVLKTSLNGIMCACELATPITYQLTPTEVKSILGQNHVWADCGDVELTYSTNAVRGNPYLIGMEDVNGAVNSLQTDVDNLSSTVNDYLGEKAWITLDTQKDDNGNVIPIMRLGSSSDPLSPKIQAVLTNEKLDFRVNNNSVAYIAVDTDDNNTGKLFASNNLVASEIQFGDWVWYQRPNGHLSVKWKGGNNL